MKLYLMRHGKAAAVQEDPEEGLTEQGRQEIEQLAKRLADQGVTFDRVLHSEKTRAKQTAHIMAERLAPAVTPQMKTGLKPNDDPRELIPELETWQQDTLVTSHLPFVPMLLTRLTGENHGMNIVPGSVFCLDNTHGDWRVEWVMSP
jgi:phosphohistidine phosphatase